MLSPLYPKFPSGGYTIIYMFESLCILGRQPAIGLAELESLYGAELVQPVGVHAALLNMKPGDVPFAFLGGTVKFCKVLTELDTTRWHEVQKFLVKAVPEHAKSLPGGKLRLGLSIYGLKVEPRQITGTALELKKVLKTSGRAVRVVPNNEPALNSAQVLHNKLTSDLGWELIFVRSGSRTIVAQSIAVQDIEAYARRDRERPKRDARVGMLPPKLAQIIVNLASGSAPKPDCGPAKPNGKILLDPFCGTGVILMESLLMGYDVYGTDSDERMAEYSEANLTWLMPGHKPPWKLEVADATNHTWNNFDTVATEAYLGRPFTTPPGQEILSKTASEVNTITKKFLQNLANQTKSGFRACLALPAWSVGSSFKHLPVLDQLTDMGYTRVSFVHASDKELIYHRAGQFVGRELVTLIRK